MAAVFPEPPLLAKFHRGTRYRDINTTIANRLLTLLVLALFILTGTGCVSVPGEPDPNDAWEPFNRGMYDFNDGIDKDIIEKE